VAGASLGPCAHGWSADFVDDVDADGDADFITSLKAHGSGIAWFDQTASDKFTRHDIIGASSTDNPYGVTFREPHRNGLRGGHR